MSYIQKVSSKLKFIITATILGNLLQWFDFSLFGMMLPLFMRLFFPDERGSFFFLLFAMGAFARPFGGIVFGYLGDTGGRKNALVKTILFMTIPILLVALLPTHREIGMSAGIILGVIYLFQGFCVGGEFPGSIVFLTESAPPKNRGFIGSWSYFGVTLGMLLVSLDVFTMERTLSPSALISWGWRIPFFVGAFIGVVGVCMRHFLHETAIFQEAKKEGLLVQRPILDILKKEKEIILKGMGIYLTDALGFNLIVIFSNFYLTQHLGLDLSTSFQLNLFTISLLVISIPIFAYASNRVGMVRFAKGAAGVLFFAAFPLYLLIGMGSLPLIYLVQGFLALLLSAYVCNMPGVLYALFPTRVRYSGIGIVVNLSVALFGGTAPFIIHKLIDLTHYPALPGLYLMMGAFVSYLCLRSINR